MCPGHTETRQVPRERKEEQQAGTFPVGKGKVEGKGGRNAYGKDEGGMMVLVFVIQY